jgi:Flp pilus assembly protein TadD
LLEGRFAAAAEFIDQAEVLAPRRPEALILRGVHGGRLTADLDGAERAYTGPLERAPHGLLAAAGLARVLLGHGNRKEALTFIRSLQHEHPKHPVVGTLVAEAYLLNDEPQTAVALLQKSRTARTGDVAAAELMIRAFIRLGQREQALLAVRELLVLNPHSRFAARARAPIDLQHGDTAAARAALRRMPPDDFPALELPGRAYLGQGNTERAGWYLQQARAIATANAARPRSIPVSLWADFIPATVSDARIETVVTAAERQLSERRPGCAFRNRTGAFERWHGSGRPRRVSRGDPRHIPSLLALARLEAAAGQGDVAKLMYPRVLAVERTNVEALVGLTKLASSASASDGVVARGSVRRAARQRSARTARLTMTERRLRFDAKPHLIAG